MAESAKLVVAMGLLAILGHPGRSQEPPYAEFRGPFDQALQADDQQEIDRLIGLAPNDVALHFTYLCKDRRLDAGDSVTETQRLVVEGWRRVYGDDTVLVSYELFYAEQPPRVLAELEDLEITIRRSHVLLTTARRSLTRRDFEAALEGFLIGAQTYSRLGDELHAAQAWQVIAYIYDRIPDQTREDREKLIGALERFVDCREAWRWTGDSAYEQNFLYLRELTLRLLGRATRGRQDLPFDPGAEELVLELEFAPLTEPEPDLFSLGGPLPLLWPEVQLLGEQYERLRMFKRTDLFLRREGNSYWISAGTMASDQATRVHADSDFRTSEFSLDEETPYAMWFYVGSQNERFMSADLDYSATRDRALVFYRSAASWTITVDGRQVTFYDDNCDGILFNPDPFSPGLKLRTLGEVSEIGTPVPAYDSMRVGGERRVPGSEVIRVGEIWYALRALEDSGKVGLRRLDPRRLETGNIVLDWRPTDESAPEVMVIHGTGNLRGFAFDISTGTPVEVPAGEYEIGFGRIAVGNGRQRRIALIFKGSSEAFRVEKGETFELGMGAPFSLDYDREGTDTLVVIDSTKIRVLGRSGAVYSHLNNAVPTPQVLYSRNADGSNARRIGRFRAVRDSETAERFAQFVPLLGINAIAFPLPQRGFNSGDPVMRIPVPSGVVVGLEQDRHPLFDRLIPVWKGHAGGPVPGSPLR